MADAEVGNPSLLGRYGGSELGWIPERQIWRPVLASRTRHRQQSPRIQPTEDFADDEARGVIMPHGGDLGPDLRDLCGRRKCPYP